MITTVCSCHLNEGINKIKVYLFNKFITTIRLTKLNRPLLQENRPACKGKGGGPAFIIKNTVNYSILNTTNDDKHLEVQGIKVTLGETNVNIINTYIPPSSSCDSNYTASISNLLKLEDSIIVGDFNFFTVVDTH